MHVQEVAGSNIAIVFNHVTGRGEVTVKGRRERYRLEHAKGNRSRAGDHRQCRVKRKAGGRPPTVLLGIDEGASQ
jgi:hypothetical protein